MLLTADLPAHSLYFQVQNFSYFSFFSELHDSHWSMTMVETLVQVSVFLVSVVSNIGAFMLILQERRLVDSTLLTLNLFVADLLFVCTIPFVITVRWTKDWKLGSGACCIVLYFICLSGCVTIITLAAISIERLLAILKMEATPSLNPRKSSGVLLLTWFSTAIALLPLSLFSKVVTVISHEQTRRQICTIMWPHLTGEIIWTIAFIALGFLLPAASIVISYSKILQIRQLSKKRLHSFTSHRSSLACPVSKQDYKLFRTLLILMVSFFVMWGPIFIFIILILVHTLKVHVPITSTAFFWVVTFTMANSALNPVLYSVYQLRLSWQKLCCTKEITPSLKTVAHNPKAQE